MANNYLLMTPNLLRFTGTSFINDVASLCQCQKKSVGGNLLVIFVLFFTLTSGQKAIAHNASNGLFKAQITFLNYHLLTASSQGRSSGGGGGGHGNGTLLSLL